MKKIGTAVFLLLSASCFAQSPDVTVHGEVKGLKAGKWVYWIQLSGDYQQDSVQATENGFHFKVSIAEGQGSIYNIIIGGKNDPGGMKLVYLDKGTVNIKGDAADFKDAKLSGSQSANEQENYDRYVDGNPQLAGAKALTKRANELYRSDSAGYEKMRPELDRIDSIRNVLSKQWVRQHPASPVSAYVVDFVLRRKMNMDELESALNNLSAAGKNNILAKEMEQSVAANKLTGIGQMAPDFTENDTLGKPVSLHDFRGKYVLLDFWASWCHPCRMENPNVAAAYKKYKDQRFTILSVSLDKSRENWLKAIHEDGLDWTHVSDLKLWSSAVPRQYNVQGIPSNVLISPEGKIVAKDLRGEELGKKLEEVLE